jgi:hypothetical protein
MDSFNIMKSLFLFFIISSLVSCSSVKYRSLSPETALYMKESTLYFIGNINNESLTRFSEIVKNNKIDKRLTRTVAQS